MSSTFETSKELYQTVNNTTQYAEGHIEARIKIVAKMIGDDKKILDVGCYDGYFAQQFMKNNNEVYGLDASNDAVEEAIKKGISAQVADVEGSFPFPDEVFDIVHAGEIIEHLLDTDKFVEECRRVLKKGGSFIVTTPNTLSLPRRILYLLGMGRFFEASNTFSAEPVSVGHIRFFTKKLLKDFIESNGFELVEYTSDYINFPYFQSELLARIKPTFGRTLIMKFKKQN